MHTPSPRRPSPEASASGLRILVVSQMWPGPDAPDLGIFVLGIARELERRGHRVDRATIDRRGGSRLKYLRLGAAAVRAAVRGRPDVVYAHFLVPAGALAAVASCTAGAPLVATVHGTDVRNIGRVPGVRALSRLTVRRATRVIAVSNFLSRGLVAKLDMAPEQVEVIDSGVDLERFRPGDRAEARRRLGLGEQRSGGDPVFVCIGTLDERKNVVALAEAFERVGRGSLVFVGDGPLRARLEGRPRVRVMGRIPHEEIADWIAASDVVCQPSTEEPFGQALLEAMACERPVLATSVGGPPEFVTPEAGVLVDPASVDSIAEGLRRACALPSPNPEARRVAAEHDVRTQAERIAGVLRAAVEA